MNYRLRGLGMENSNSEFPGHILSEELERLIKEANKCLHKLAKGNQSNAGDLMRSLKDFELMIKHVTKGAYRPKLEMKPPSYFRNWKEPEDFVLCGEAYVRRGGFHVLAGHPGTGKSRASVALAIAGATGKSWFDMPIRHCFKTLIIQMENGVWRIKQELDDITRLIDIELDEWMRITPPPKDGFDLT